jgi:protein-disulfide isomerase
MPPTPRSHGGGGRRNRTLALLVGVAAGVAAVLVAGSLLLGGGDEGEPTQITGDTALVDGLPQDGTVLGDPAAKVTLYQYEDIQCPYCLRYTVDLFPLVVDEYVRTGKAKVDFRGLALLGEDSTQALRAVLAAAKQGKAWQLIELLYANQGEEGSGWVTDVLIDDLAAPIDGLDLEQLHTDAESAAVTAEIAKVQAEAEHRGVEGTPWFFVKRDGGPLVELRPDRLSAATLRTTLDNALQG